MRSNVYYENKECSYCGSEMKIAKLRTKRAVPQGAKDLGLFDEVVCWKCPQCEQTTTKTIEVCDCGSYMLSGSNQAPDPNAYEKGAPHFQVKLMRQLSDESATGVGNDYRCTACIKCYECHQALNTYDFVEGEDYTHIVRDEISYNNRPIIQMTYAYFHKPCLDKRQRADAEKKRQKEEEIRRRFEEEKRQKEEKERQRRIQKGLCITCGSPLGFTDKMTGRQTHKRC
jgi:hypothetical protein